MISFNAVMHARGVGSGDGASVAGWLLDAIQHCRLEPDVISFDAIMHARGVGSGRRCWSCRMRYSSAGWSLM